MKLRVLFIASLFELCLATNINQDESNRLLMNNSQKWEQIYEELFDSFIIKKTSFEVEQKLSEMFELEESDELKSQMVDVNSRFGDYKMLEKSCHLNGLIVHSSQSLTETLLETFDQDSMNCSEENVKRLVKLSDLFEPQSDIHLNLMQNIDLLYQNCWLRYVNILEALTSLLSRQDLQILDKIEQLIYFPEIMSKPYVIMEAANDNVQDIELETVQYAQAIANVLQQLAQYRESQADANDDFVSQLLVDYETFIEAPCKRLVELGLDLQVSIISYISSIREQKRYMKQNQIDTVNRFKMCQLIIKKQRIRSKTFDLLVANRIEPLQKAKSEQQMMQTSEPELITTTQMPVEAQLSESPSTNLVDVPIKQSNVDEARLRRQIRSQIRSSQRIGLPNRANRSDYYEIPLGITRRRPKQHYAARRPIRTDSRGSTSRPSTSTSDNKQSKPG